MSASVSTLDGIDQWANLVDEDTGQSRQEVLCMVDYMYGDVEVEQVEPASSLSETSGCLISTINGDRFKFIWQEVTILFFLLLLQK